MHDGFINAAPCVRTIVYLVCEKRCHRRRIDVGMLIVVSVLMNAVFYGGTQTFVTLPVAVQRGFKRLKRYFFFVVNKLFNCHYTVDKSSKPAIQDRRIVEFYAALVCVDTFFERAFNCCRIHI